MNSHSIYWGEGVFLRPQHFQYTDRLNDNQAAVSSRWDNPHYYGLHRWELDTDSLANWRISIAACQLRLPDGTLLRVPEDAHLNAEPIPRHLFPNADARVKIYVGVAELKLGANNTEEEHPGALTRYLNREVQIEDENSAGASEKIQVRVLNPRILIGDDAARGYDCVPIMQLRLGATAEAPPEIDPDYIPPVISLESSPQLQSWLKGICDQLGAESQRLSQQIQDRGVAFASGHREDLEMISRLQAVNASLGGLICLTGERSIHPFQVYRQFCHAVGHTAIFKGNRAFPQIPVYDHDNLFACFKKLYGLLAAGEERKQDYVRQPFSADGMVMTVRLQQEWLAPDWAFYIGVECELPSEEVKELLSEAALGMKVGSAEEVDAIFRRGLFGVQILPVAEPPRVFPRKNWHFFRVDRDRSWERVEATMNLGIRFNERDVEKQVRGENRIDVRNRITNDTTSMAFSLFAIRAMG